MKQCGGKISALFAVVGCASMLTLVEAMAADNTPTRVDIPSQLVAKLAVLAATDAPKKSRMLSVFDVFDVFDTDALALSPDSADLSRPYGALALLYPDPTRDRYRTTATVTPVGAPAAAFFAISSSATAITITPVGAPVDSRGFGLIDVSALSRAVEAVRIGN